MKKFALISALTAASLGISTAQEGTTYSSHNTPWSAGINASTLGFGAELGYMVNNSFVLRGTFNYLPYSRKVSGSDFNISGKLKFMTAGLMADWHVMQNGFRLTAGLVYNNNRVDLKASAKNSTVKINGTLYTATQIGDVTGRLDFKKVSPYLGVGYDSSHSRYGLGFTAEVGALFQGKPRGKVTSITGLLVNQAKAINDVKDEIVKETNKSWLRVYPVVKIGLTYRF